MISLVSCFERLAPCQLFKEFVLFVRPFTDNTFSDHVINDGFCNSEKQVVFLCIKNRLKLFVSG